MGNIRSARDPYQRDLRVSKEDLQTIRKLNWFDGFLWGALLGGISVMLLSLFVSVMFLCP
jgi:hypothetical protein